MIKDPKVLSPGPEGVFNIVTSFDPAEHARYRGKLNPAFSSRALQEQEPVIMQHVNLMIEKLDKHCTEAPQDVVKWSSLLYFDIIGDLTFGRALYNIENGNPQAWLKGLFGSTMALITIHNAINQFPHISKVLNYFINRFLVDQQVKHAKFVRESVDQRFNTKKKHRDFMSYILPYDEKVVQMSIAEVRATYGALMIAGSENVSTTLSFTVYHLLKNPDVLERLTKEVRSAFLSTDEINFVSISSLKYLSAVVNESMRIHPAAPMSKPRVVPGHGATIAGHWVPGGVRL